MKDLKTTIAGIVATIGVILKLGFGIDINIPVAGAEVSLSTAMIAIGIALAGFFSKDKDVKTDNPK